MMEKDENRRKWSNQELFYHKEWTYQQMFKFWAYLCSKFSILHPVYTLTLHPVWTFDIVRKSK